MLPGTLDLHGDRGNLMALERYAKLAGYTVETDDIELDDPFDALSYDAILVPPGSCASYREVIGFFAPHKAALEEFVGSGRPLMVTGQTVSVFGNDITLRDGTKLNGIGLINVTTKERDFAYGDDLYYKASYGGTDMEIIGSQIQMTDVFVGEEKPFGELIYGYGNNGKDRTEGVIKNNSVFTNTLGPLLILTPWLTKEMITAAAAARGENVEFSTDEDIERKSFETKKEFILNKRTALTNPAERPVNI